MQLNLIGHCYGLSDEETKDLWFQADIDGNGVIDYKQFLVKYLDEFIRLLPVSLFVFVSVFHDTCNCIISIVLIDRLNQLVFFI